jgi:hypothetical protein
LPQSIHNSVLSIPQLPTKFLLNEQGAMALSLSEKAPPGRHRKGEKVCVLSLRP